MKRISGSVCAAEGFTAAGTHCGVKKSSSKLDLALIYSEKICNAAAVYTTNLVKGAPITVTRENLSDGKAQAVICNSGNANTCNANGLDVAREMCALTGEALGIPASNVIVASTGVIGQPMDIAPIKTGVPVLAKSLTRDAKDALHAIMTTDTRDKECAFEFTAGGKTCRVGAMAKGSGMIHPNMATMLVYVTTDAAISSDMLKASLLDEIETTFHMISIDGDTSTNDMVCVMANGMAGNAEICAPGADFSAYCEALHAVFEDLCKKVAADGEGATKLIECAVSGAKDWKSAKSVAKSVINSALFKSMIFGADANWGRVMCAMGYSGADIDPSLTSITFSSEAGEVRVSENGTGLDYSEELATEILKKDAVRVGIDLGMGAVSATAWGCDLTYDYVKINGDYRS